MKKLFKVKEFGQLTNVTVKALHHYDRIGLLSPKQKTASGYRLYAESDISRLQQIVTLKFLGMSLAEIKQLITSEDIDLLRTLKIQSIALNERLLEIKTAAKLLQKMTAQLEAKADISWEDNIKLIKVMQMSDQKIMTWCRENLTPDENIKLKNIWGKYDEEFRRDYDTRWAELFKECAKYKDEDPTGEHGLMIGKKGNDLISEVWGENRELGRKIWEKSKIDSPMRDNIDADDKTVEFFDLAVKNYIMKFVIKK